MKIKLILIAVLLTGITFTYTACKKSSSNNSSPALTPKQVSSQIALNITQTLYDGFGGFSLTNGLSAPGTLGVIHTKGGLRLNDATDPLCGTVADTTLDDTETSNGTTVTVKGNLKFSFSCASGVLSGFNITDNLAIGESSSDLTLVANLAENLTLLATDPQSDISNASLNGTLSYGGSWNFKTGSKGTAAQSYSYNFKSILIDSSGDILSGSATFTTTGSGASGSWNYSGTITFLGNGSATITIGSSTFNVNLTTGVVS